MYPQTGGISSRELERASESGHRRNKKIIADKLQAQQLQAKEQYQQIHMTR
jgi:hypothetical protein